MPQSLSVDEQTPAAAHAAPSAIDPALATTGSTESHVEQPLNEQTRHAEQTLDGEQSLHGEQCPLCSGAGQRQFAADGIWVCDCQGCGHRFAALSTASDHVATIYGDDYFTAGGAGYSDYLQEANLLRASGRLYARELAPFMPAGDMLDVGAAAGFLLQGFIDGGWSGSGVEPNDRMASHARDVLGLNVTTGALDDYPADRQFDLVSMIQVAPHLADLHKSFDRLSALVKPGGCCLIETWDRQSVTARVLGKHWHEYSPPSVLHWFSRQSLARLLDQHGFSLVTQGRRLKWINGDHARSLVEFKLASSRWGRRAAGLLDLVPRGLAIPYPSEDLFWALFRKRAES